MSQNGNTPSSPDPPAVNQIEEFLGKNFSRRSFLKTAGAVGAGALLAQNKAFGAMFGFMSPVNVDSPLKGYPNRDWEKTYRDLYSYDSTFHFLCAPNDTHNCLLTAYVKNGVITRLGPSFGFGKAGDTDGNMASHRWDPRCCNKGLAMVRRFYSARRVKQTMMRRGFKEWVEAGFPRDPVNGAVQEQYLNRGKDPFIAVSFDLAHEYHARALKNIAETYNGDMGMARLKAQGYDEAMVAATQGAGVQVLKFRGGMAALGATRIFAQYRLANSMALLDNNIRGLGPEKSIGARGWDNYSWHTDLPPGHPMVTGQQSHEFDLCNVEHANMVLVWGMNWITTKMPDGHWLTEARLKGTKVVVIAAEYSATACKGDEVLIVRPGVTPALALGFAHVIVKEKLYDEKAVKGNTDLPLLVREDTGEMLRAKDVFPAYVNQPLSNHVTLLKEGEKPVLPLMQSGPIIPQAMRDAWGDYVVYDTKTKGFKAVCRDDFGENFHKLGIDPALEGAFPVKLVDGKEIVVKPLFAQVKQVLMDSYDPKTVSELTWAPVEGILSIARQIAKNKTKTLFAMGMGPNQYFNNDLKDRAVFLVAALTNNVGHAGGNVGSYAGNYRAACFSGLPNYIMEDPFHPQLDPTQPAIKRPYFKTESVHYWNHGDTVLRMGNTLLTGKSHIPTPTKAIHVSNSNSLIGNAKGHYETVVNTMKKTEMVAINEWWWTPSCEYGDIIYAIDSWAEMKLPDVTLSVTNPFLYIYPDTPLPRIFDTRSDMQVAAGLSKAMAKVTGDARFEQMWAFVESDHGKPYLKRVLATSNVSAGYDMEKLIADAKKGVPALMMTRTSPKSCGYEQTNENKPYYTKTGRLEFYREEPEFRDSGENLPLHREPIDSTFYEPNVIVAKPHPLIKPKGPEAYGVPREQMDADTRQARHVQKTWAEVKLTKHPLMAEGHKFIFHTPKYRHGAHTSGVDIDIVAIWFGPFSDMRRRDKRQPYINEMYVDINPRDARDMGLNDGDYVYIDADPHSSPYHGWKATDEAYDMARLQVRCRFYPGTPRGVLRMWHNVAPATYGTRKGHLTRADGLARNDATGYMSMFRSGSHQSCTRGYLKPTWMTETLVRKDLFGQTVGVGFAPDVHCPTGAPRESFVKVTKKEDGGLNGKGLWEPAAKGLRPTYENASLKKFIQGGYVKKG